MCWAVTLLFLMFVSFVWADLGEELIQAAENGDLTEVEKLLEAGADVNKQNNDGETALFFAAEHGYVEIAEKLIEEGADVNVQNNNGGTTLMYAIEYGYTEIMEMLRNAGAVE